ncbi:MAG: hypothetical protein WBZ36_10265 [Candidatus Nitrosopolaris sp.]
MISGYYSCGARAYSGYLIRLIVFLGIPTSGAVGNVVTYFAIMVYVISWAKLGSGDTNGSESEGGYSK